VAAGVRGLRLLTLALVVVAVAPPRIAPAAEPYPLGPMARSITTEAAAPYGICYGEARLWVLDTQSKTITRTDPDTGCRLRSIPAPGERPTDLAYDGRYLWVLSAGGVFVTDPDSGDVVAATPLDFPDAEGIALDDTRVWLADRKSSRILTFARQEAHVDPKVRYELPAPGISPRGMCYHEGSLWLIDSVDRTLYRIDPTSGEVTAAIFAEREIPRSVTFVRGEPVVSYQQDRIVEPLEYETGEGCWRSCKHRVRVVYTHSLENASPMPIKNVRLKLALPPTTPHQEIRSLRLDPAPQEMTADRYGQPLARYWYDQLAPKEKIEVRWTVEADLWAVRYSGQASAGADNGEDLSIYLAASRNLPLDNQAIRQAAQSVSGIGDRLAKVRAARDYVLGRLTYELAGGWDDAATVLERGNGSCSEYSFVLSSILRCAGIPTRFVGGTAKRGSEKTSEDRVFHRWIEVHVPGAGWLPVDANRDDRKDGPPFGTRSFLATDWPLLTISRGGGDDESGLGSEYRSAQRWDWGENKESDRRVRTLRVAAWEILE
jgi:transglutaminase-like putative cysteine protease